MSAKTKKRTPAAPQRVMDCPVATCTDGPKGGRQRGAVSGIKKHVRMKHPDVFAKIENLFPPARGQDGLEARTVDELRQIAKVAGIPDTHSKKKDALISAIDEMPKGRKGSEK